MIEHVIQRPGNAERTAEPEPQRDHAHMFHAGVSHQPFDAGLADDEKSSDEKRESAERDEACCAPGKRCPAASATAR